ncbi:uncharacterized protein LOC134467187 [Engraulis encrasicolus]|uniref:uncharacterized protein LOC134467187 n=1 Tax=Engraulis encrasicolus TaxID=184585 RepID=UPI002FD3EDE2
MEICQTVLKVASSSSMGMILPVFARMERDLGCYSYTPSRSQSAGSSSSDKTSGAPEGLGSVLRMQGALAAFHKCTAAWRRPALANAVRPPSMTKLRIYCAKRRPSPDLPDVATVTRPSTVTELRIYSANRMASPDLPDVATMTRPSTVTELRAYSANRVPSPDLPEVATMTRPSTVTELRVYSANRVPSPDLPKVASVLPHEGESHDPTGINGVLEKVLSNEDIDHVAQHLVGQMQGVLQEDRPSVTKCCASPQLTEMYSYAETAIKDLLQPYFQPLVAHAASVDNAELKCAASAAPDAVDAVEAKDEDAVSSQSRAQSARSSTASCELDMIQPDSSALRVRASMVSLFTDLMVNQMMDELHLDVPAQHDAADETDAAIAGDADGCLTTVLMLRLLATLRDGGRSPVDKGMIQELIDNILSEISGASGVPNVHGYLNNTRIQNINRTMEKFLLKEFGSKNILQRAANPKDNSFNMTFLAKLSKVLNAEVTGAPAAMSGSSFLGSEPKATGGMKTGKKSKFGVKIPNRRKRSSKVSPINIAADNKDQQTVTPAPSGNTSAAAAGKVSPRKRSWIKKLFSCCLPKGTEF